MLKVFGYGGVIKYAKVKIILVMNFRNNRLVESEFGGGEFPAKRSFAMRGGAHA